jgi:hypothetical protein
LAARLAQTHVGVIAWARTGNPELGDWDSARRRIRHLQQVENEGGLAQLLIRFRQAVCLLGQDFDDPTGRLKMKKDSPPGEDRRAIQAIRIG